MKTSYTPGPWLTHPNYEVVYSSGKRICIIVSQGGSLKPQDKENAQLIAAAPDLLEALRGLIHSVEHEGEIHGRIVYAVENAKNIIKKATNYGKK